MYIVIVYVRKNPVVYIIIVNIILTFVILNINIENIVCFWLITIRVGVDLRRTIVSLL